MCDTNPIIMHLFYLTSGERTEYQFRLPSDMQRRIADTEISTSAHNSDSVTKNISYGTFDNFSRERFRFTAIVKKKCETKERDALTDLKSVEK